MNLDRSCPIADYAAKYWFIHAHAGGNNKSQSSSVIALTMRLPTDKNTAFLNSVHICDMDDYYLLGWPRERVKIGKPLYYASLIGLTEASSGDHQTIASMLTDKGADVNAQGGHYGNALQAASYEGHEVMAQHLIEKGADINALNGYYGNALQAASYGGCKVIAKLLMEQGQM